MMEAMKPAERTGLDPVRATRLALGAEAGGYYNASKLWWALAYSEEVRQSRAEALPTGQELIGELDRTIAELESQGTDPAVVRALRRGRDGIAEDRTIPASDVPRTFVCRTCGHVALGEPPGRCPTCSAHPLTFREILPVWFLEPLTPEQVLSALESGPAEVAAAIEGLTDDEMSRSPGPGEWSIRDVLFHIHMGNEVMAGRVEVMLREEDPWLEALAVWAMQDQESLRASQVIERYRETRRRLVETLRAISPHDWWRTARHPEFVRFNVLQQTSYHAKHERTHLPQIRELRRTLE